MPDTQSRRDPNVVAMLSLFLLLLAFFILLNALSELRQDKTRAVIESVSDAFDGQVQTNESRLAIPAALQTLPNAAELLREIGELFSSFVPTVKLEASENADLMRLTVPDTVVFRPDSLELQPGRVAMFERFIENLTDGRYEHLEVRLELDHGVPRDATGKVAESSARSLEVGRMGALARDFSARGFPEERLGAGLVPGPAGMITISLRLNLPAAPVPDAPDTPERLGAPGR